MNWLGKLLMDLFPPEGTRRTPSGGYIGTADKDTKRYMNWLGTTGMKQERGQDYMMVKGKGWQRVPPLAEWLRNHGGSK